MGFLKELQVVCELMKNTDIFSPPEIKKYIF